MFQRSPFKDFLVAQRGKEVSPVSYLAHCSPESMHIFFLAWFASEVTFIEKSFVEMLIKKKTKKNNWQQMTATQVLKQKKENQKC